MSPDIFFYILCSFFGLLLISLTIFAYQHGTGSTSTPKSTMASTTAPSKTWSRIIHWQQNRSTRATTHASDNSVQDIEMQTTNVVSGNGSKGKTDGSRDYVTDTTPTENVVFENIARISNHGNVFRQGGYERLRPGRGC